MHDLVLSGGHVVDGTGGAAFRADVAVEEGRIAALGHPGAARRVIDVSGHFVAPGFVDMHSHSDLALLAEPTAEAKVMQGVTGEVIGQDGLAYAPLRRLHAGGDPHPDRRLGGRSARPGLRLALGGGVPGAGSRSRRRR